MKSNAIIRIVLFSIAILVLLAILGAGIAADLLMFDLPSGRSDGIVSSTGTADADVVRNLSIEWEAGSITIRPSDVTEITLTETGAEGTEPMVWLATGDTLKVAYVEREGFLHFGTNSSKDLLIEVPMDWSCGELEVETAAANMEIEGLTLSKVDFDGASGILRFIGCTVDAMDIDTASGDVEFSGSLYTLDCDAASADCVLALRNCPSRIEMDMASGDLELTLPEDCGFTVKLEALSGDFDSDFEVTRTGGGFLSGDGACRIDISAMSGDVYIGKA